MLSLFCCILGCAIIYLIFELNGLSRIQQKAENVFEQDLRVLQIYSTFRRLGFVGRFSKHWWLTHMPLVDERCYWRFGPELKREYFEIICLSTNQLTFSYRPRDEQVVGLMTLLLVNGEEQYYEITALRMGSLEFHQNGISEEALQIFILTVMMEVGLPILIDLRKSNIPESIFLALRFNKTPHGLTYNFLEEVERWV